MTHLSVFPVSDKTCSRDEDTVGPVDPSSWSVILSPLETRRGVSSGRLCWGLSKCFLTVSVPVLWLLDLRLPHRPVINTPIVSALVYSEGAPLPRPLERPVLVEFALLEVEERTKPVCVFWNHSLA